MRIRAFYNFLVDEKIVKENIAKKVKMQRADVKIDVFTDEHIRQMLATIEGCVGRNNLISRTEAIC